MTGAGISRADWLEGIHETVRDRLFTKSCMDYILCNYTITYCTTILITLEIKQQKCHGLWLERH
jgi:hypothetical protein